MDTDNSGHGGPLSDMEFPDELIADGFFAKATDRSFSSPESIDRDFFDKIKTDMVMRIYGVSPEKARQIIASAAMPTDDED